MTDRLRIAQVAPIARPVAPDSASAIEQLVSLLCEELVRRGHEMTLFATGDSSTTAELAALYAHGYRHDQSLWDNWQFHELVHLCAAFERASDFDVIHSHTYQFAPPLAGIVETPALHTDHMPADRDVVDCYRRHPQTRLVTVSEYLRRKRAGVRTVEMVHNGIDFQAFPFEPTGGDYLLFVGHLIERKDPIAAIELARWAGMRLLLAGKGDDEYFQDRVAPLIDGRSVEHIGPVGVAERNRLLAGAGALVFTSAFSEPFGLVMLEAMACGTPVLALDRCAVSEIVTPGLTGYHAETLEALAGLVPDALALDRRAVRAAAERRFGHHRMADGYEAIYRRLLAERDLPGRPWRPARPPVAASARR